MGLPSYGSILQVNEIVLLEAEYLIREFHHLVSKIYSIPQPPFLLKQVIACFSSSDNFVLLVYLCEYDK